MSNKVGVDPQSDYQEVKVKNSQKQGKLLDTRLMAGPLAERNCTDILCCLLFIANIGLLGYLAIAGYTKGQPARLVAAYDPDGLACGLDKCRTDYPYLYFAIPYKGYFNRTTCVKECPSYALKTDEPTSLNCQVNTRVTSCKRNCFNFDDLTSGNITMPPDSKLWDLNFFVCVFNTSVAFDRVCYPQKVLELMDSTSDYASSVNLDQLTTWIEDINTTSSMIYASFGIAFILGIIYLILTRWLAGIIIWLSIFLYFVGLAFLAYLCNNRKLQYEAIMNDKTGKYTLEESSKASDNKQTFEILTYVVYGIIAASLFGLICIFNKIRLAVAVIKTAAVFVRDEILIILVPPVSACFTFALWIWWIFTAVFIYSLGEIKGDGNSPFATVTLSELNKQQIWYFVFGGLWVNAFIQAMNDFIIASACCIWYFSQGTGQGAHRAISTSVYRAFRYHLGSLAFGSLILAIVQFIRIILEYVRLQMEAAGGSKNKVTRCLISCLTCVMACFERCIRFLTRNAYIQIALTGKSFCPAAKDAFETIFANSMRYTLVGGIGGAFIFVKRLKLIFNKKIGKCCITITTVVIFYYIITGVDTYSSKLFSPVLPCIIVLIIAYSVSLLFMSVYGMACDTILACFIYDEDLNKQNGGTSATHCPETLREFFEMPELVRKMKEHEEKQQQA